MSGFNEYGSLDGLGLADLVRKGEVHPVELVEEAIRRIEQFNPHLNAVIQKMYDQGRTAATAIHKDAPFAGVPFLLKDLLADYAGVPTTRGCRFHLKYVPERDSEMVRRFKAAGVIILGKTNTPEYGLWPVTEPELFGPTSNPWDRARTPGGSSGGSAAAVASRMVPLAHGNDGGGSIRIPASCCGVFGLKPSRGRNPLGPVQAEAWQGLACDHVLTRSVRDSAAMLDATSGPDIGAPYFCPGPSRPFLEEVGKDSGKLRIAFTARSILPVSVHPDCLAALEEGVRLCQEMGHEVVEESPEIEGQEFAKALLTMVFGETRADIEEAETLMGERATFGDFEVATWAGSLIGRQLRAGEFARAARTLKRSARLVGRFFERFDVLLTPTLACPPPASGALRPRGIEAKVLRLLARFNAGRLINRLADTGTLADRVFAFTPFTALFNATGQPAMSVPLCWNGQGLPIGLQFVARYGDEATLFRLAGTLEKIKPWHQRIPADYV